MQKSIKILIVDDDPDIVELLAYNLKKNNFTVYSIYKGNEVFPFLDNNSPDLILLDIMLPGIDGFKILHRLRSDYKTKDLPVIMLTARGEIKDRSEGLDRGADDYICKPFSPREVISRINAVLRRANKSTGSEKITFGSLVIDKEQFNVSIDGEEINLSLKELKLLFYLIENTPRPVERKELLEKVWEYNYIGDTRTVDVHIRYLRNKLGKYGDLITTVKGIGYKFNGK